MNQDEAPVDCAVREVFWLILILSPVNLFLLLIISYNISVS